MRTTNNITLNEAIHQITGDPNFWKKFFVNYQNIENFAKFREEVKEKLGIDIIFNIEIVRITSHKPVYMIDPFDFDKKMKAKYPELNIA